MTGTVHLLRERGQRQRWRTTTDEAVAHRDAGDRSLHVVGSLTESRIAFHEAFRLARCDRAADEMARSALGLGGLWVHEHRGAADTAVVEACQHEALAALPGASPLAARLRVRLAAESDYRAGTSDAIMSALADARRSGDAGALAEALSLAHHCVLGPDHVRTRLALAEELLRTAAATGRRVDLLTGLTWRAVDLLLAGRPTAERAVAELRSALAETPHGALGYVSSAIDVMLATRAGRFDRAAELIEVCAARGTGVGDADVGAWRCAQVAALAWYRGTMAQLRPQLEVLAHSPGLGAIDLGPVAALAVASAAAGERMQAEALVARVRGELAGPVRGSGWLVTAYAIIEAAHLLGDADVAAEIAGLLAPYADLPMTASLAVACFGSTHHALGVAAITCDDLDAAVTHFADATRHNLALGHLPAATLSQHWLGRALARRAHPADLLAAQAALAAAAERADRLGVVLPSDDTVRIGTVGSSRVTLERHGRNWTIAVEGRRVQVADCVGLRHLERLVRADGHEVAALDLVGGEPGAYLPTSAASQEVVDRMALDAYRRRLAELDDLAGCDDAGRAAAARDERDWLLAELRRATGLRGAPRSFVTDAERARVAVTKAIKRALDRIADEDPAVESWLRERVRTGVLCSFDTSACLQLRARQDSNLQPLDP